MIDKKICLVVQRYGLEVNGGAELQCRQIAERLTSYYREIHVLTTKAIDYVTWKDEYTQDEEQINGVFVHRFGVEHPRNQKTFDEINGRFFAGKLKPEEELEWMEKQGPTVPKMITYLKEHRDDYEAFVFFTYLYYSTAMCLPVVADKAVLVPEAHDDPFYRMHIFDDVFLKPQGILFNTTEEQSLIHKKYNNSRIPSAIGGVGVDLPGSIDGERFKEKYQLSDYVVYVGRIDVSKNCDMLFQYFKEYKKRNNRENLKLVLMGKTVIEIPQCDDIVNLGFVEEQDKFDGIAGARTLLLPSEFESLSMVVLEAMSVYTPVMVYGKCAVLRGHCTKSNGALYFNNYFEFEKQLELILMDNELRSVMIENAYEYVQNNYRWDIILDRLVGLIEGIDKK